MSIDAVEKTTHELELFPLHEVFLESFFTPNAVPYHSLSSPCGAGTFTLLVALIRRAIDHHGANRVFVIIPSHLHEACRLLLQGRSGACLVERVTVARFRELEAQKVFGESLWPEKIVAILDERAAARPEISHSLATTKWDLAVFDARDTAPSTSAGCIESVLQRGYALRFLLVRVGDNALFDFWSFKPVLENTKWEAAQIADCTGRYALQISGPKAIAWNYHRRNFERDILEDVDSLIGLLSESNQAKLVRDSLLQRMASGIPALDHGVNLLMRRLLHYRAACGDEGGVTLAAGSRQQDHDHLSEAASQVQAVWRNPERALAHIERTLIRPLDEIPDDKLDLLQAKVDMCLCEESGRPHFICVFVSFREMASYLHSAFVDVHSAVEDAFGTEEADCDVHLLTDSTPAADRERIVERSSSRNRILVATAHALESLPRCNFTEVVHYDLPSSSCEMMLRIGACRSAGQHFAIKSGDEFEALLWEKHRSQLGW